MRKGKLGSSSTLTITIGFFISLACFLAVSNSSLWIDEGYTAYYASQPTFSVLVGEIVSSRNSEAQMPGYLLYLWGWRNIFGSSELALRLANAPFGLLLIGMAFSMPIKNGGGKAAAVLMSVSPFIWAYMNEARYAIEVTALCGSAVAGVFWYFFGRNRIQKVGPWLSAVACLLAIYFNMLSMFIIPPLLFLVWRFSKETNNPTRLIWNDWKAPVVTTVLISAPVVLYYAQTVLGGRGGMRQLPGFLNVGFALYEFWGLMGIGPSRNAMREAASFGQIVEYFPKFVPTIVAAISALIFTLRSKKKNNGASISRTLFFSLSLGIVCFFLAAFVAQFRFVGRHLSFVFPLFVFWLGAIWSQLTEAHKRGRYVLATLLLSSWIFSAFNLRFNPLHEKDNYRLAVAKTIEFSEPEDSILWSGAEYASGYYGIGFPHLTLPERWIEQRRANYVPLIPGDSIEAAMASGRYKLITLFNKPDLFDKSGYVRKFVREHRPALLYETPDFSIYKLQ